MVGGTFEDVEEGIVQPVKDVVGQAIEVGVKSVIQGPPTIDPKVTAKKEEERQKKIAAWRWDLQQRAALEERVKKVREEKKIAQLQKDQVVQEESQQEELVEIGKKKDDMALRQAKTKVETRGGVGG